MQEEVTQKTIAFVINTAKLTSRVLSEAMRLYLNHSKSQKLQIHKKVPIKKLMSDGDGVKTIEITEKNIKSFEKVARKYNIDFSVKKDSTVEPPKYIVFFRAKDVDVLNQAFKEYVYRNERKAERPSLKKKLERLKEIVAKMKDLDRVKNKNKEQSR